MKAYELLDSPAKWVRGELAMDEAGNHCSIHSLRAACWCVIGAIRKVYEKSEDYNEVIDKLSNYLAKNKKEPHGFIAVWNDRTNYQDVHNTLKLLDI